MRSAQIQSSPLKAIQLHSNHPEDSLASHPVDSAARIKSPFSWVANFIAKEVTYIPKKVLPL